MRIALLSLCLPAVAMANPVNVCQFLDKNHYPRWHGHNQFDSCLVIDYQVAPNLVLNAEDDVSLHGVMRLSWGGEQDIPGFIDGVCHPTSGVSGDITLNFHSTAGVYQLNGYAINGIMYLSNDMLGSFVLNTKTTY